MSAYGFMWDAIQSGQIGTLEERIESLEKDMETARAWVEYLNDRVNKLELMLAAEHMSDKGYQIGTKEAYEVFMKKRNGDV
jgi:predicted RNase H-like nuclease (RuvC/YqgF family)